MFIKASNDSETVYIKAEAIDGYGVGVNGVSFILYHSGDKPFTFSTPKPFDEIEKQIKAALKPARTTKKRVRS